MFISLKFPVHALPIDLFFKCRIVHYNIKSAFSLCTLYLVEMWELTCNLVVKDRDIGVVLLGKTLSFHSASLHQGV